MTTPVQAVAASPLPGVQPAAPRTWWRTDPFSGRCLPGTSARPPEAAVIDPANPFVLAPHLRCAARELPLAAYTDDTMASAAYYLGAVLLLAPIALTRTLPPVKSTA